LKNYVLKKTQVHPPDINTLLLETWR